MHPRVHRRARWYCLGCGWQGRAGSACQGTGTRDTHPPPCNDAVVPRGRALRGAAGRRGELCAALAAHCRARRSSSAWPACGLAASAAPPPRHAVPLPLTCPKILFYPTAIGSEPPAPGYSSYPHWARVMQGHAGANMVRVWQLCSGHTGLAACFAALSPLRLRLPLTAWHCSCRCPWWPATASARSGLRPLTSPFTAAALWRGPREISWRRWAGHGRWMGGADGDMRHRAAVGTHVPDAGVPTRGVRPAGGRTRAAGQRRHRPGAAAGAGLCDRHF